MSWDTGGGLARAGDYLRPIVGGGVSAPTFGFYNLITQASPAAVSQRTTSTLGPLNYSTAAFGSLGNRGEILLLKFSSPYQFTPAIQNISYLMPQLLYTVNVTLTTLSDSSLTWLDLFFLQHDYDPTTICWNNQPFGLTANAGGDYDMALASYKVVINGDTGLGSYSFDNSLDSASANRPVINGSGSYTGYSSVGVTTVVNPTTFTFDGLGADWSWLAGQTAYFTQGPPAGTNALVVSSTNTSGTIWQVVFSSTTGMDNTTLFYVFRKLYGIGIGINCQPLNSPTTVAQLKALAAAPVTYLDGQGI